MKIHDSYEEPKPEVSSVKVTETLTEFANQEGELTSCMMDGTHVPVYNTEDGFYHLGTENGPLIVAKISQRCEYLDASFNKIQDAGNSMLKLHGRYDYTDFIDQYAEVCNDDGVYPVTQELMLFLQRFQSSHSYFSFGGWVISQLDYKPVEDYYWMFAAYFYNV